MTGDRSNVLLLLGGQHSYRCLGRRDDDVGEPVSTPALDRLASDGVDFEQAYAPAPSGTPSRIGLLTGRTAPRAGAWDRGAVLDPGLPTLPGTLSNAGYATCLVGSMGLGGDRQFAGFDSRPYGDLTGTGGAQYDPLPNPKSRGSPAAARGASGSPARGDYSHRYDPLHPERKATGPDPWGSLAEGSGVTEIPESAHQERTVAREATAFLREHDRRRDEPWFLCASFNRPHPPLTAPRRHLERYWDLDADEPTDRLTDPPVGPDADADDHPLVEEKRAADAVADLFDPERVDPDDETVLRRARAAYFASVDYLDEVLGDFLRALRADGLLEDTVVVYAGDHGQMAGEHGLWWARTWHEAALRVPLLVDLPGGRAHETPASVSTPVSLIDLYPTLCGLCGVEAPGDLDGVDLSNAIRAGEEPDRGPVVADSFSGAWGEGTEFRAVRDGDDKYVRFRDAPDRRFDLGADPDETRDVSGDDGERSGDAGERGARRHAVETLDFDAAVEHRERDRAERADRELAIDPGTTGNAFLLPGGRLLDADAGLYKPNLLAEDAALVFEDWGE